jgi:hypothetical protein
MSDLRLYAEMVPEGSWYENARSWLTQREWTTVRTAVYRLFGGKCSVCGDEPARGRLHCHEQWSYDDATGVQSLVGLTALCARCHDIKHLGSLMARVEDGKASLSAAVRHFCRVNGCTVETFDDHVRAVVAQWEERSRRQWRVVSRIDFAGWLGHPVVNVPTGDAKEEGP